MLNDAAHHRHIEQKAQLIEAIAAKETCTTKSIKNCMAAERTKVMYQKLRAHWSPFNPGLPKIEVPADANNHNYKQCKEWITVDTPREIEHLLQERNIRHFGQAEGSFPTVPPYSKWANWGASTHTK